VSLIGNSFLIMSGANRSLVVVLVIILCHSLAWITEGNDASTNNSGGAFSSLQLLDDIRDQTLRVETNSDTITRVGNVDVLKFENGGNKDSLDEIAICHLVALFAFTEYRQPSNTVGCYESAAALALAAHHLNTGNGSIVKEVEGLNDRCNIRFTVEFQDSKLEERSAVDTVIRITDRKPVKERLPCGFFGAERSAVSMPTSIITGLRGYPQLSGISTSSDLNDAQQYPLFGRTIPSDDLTAIPLIRHLHEDLGVNHLAVLHTDDSYGNSYALGIQLAAKRIAPNMRIQNVDSPFDITPEVATRIIGELKATEYTYFMGILDTHVAFEAFLEEAYKQGIAGTGKHTWIFGDAVGIGSKGPYPKGSALANAVRGSGVISASGGISGFNLFDKLTDAIASTKNPSDLEYLKSKFQENVFPDKLVEEMPFLNETEFANSPGVMGPFIYDAAILMGLAACSAKNSSAYFDGETHFAHMQKTSFAGASGTIVLDNVTGTRTAESAIFTLHNLVVDDQGSEEGNSVMYKAVESRLFRNGEWETVADFVFNDGTTNVSKDLPPLVVDLNLCSFGFRATGLTICAIIILLSFGFAGWTVYKRETHVIKASQPIFLLIICAGSAILGASIVPLSIDQGSASQQMGDIACQITPWFVFIGFVVIFSALFTKTHRINKLFSNPSFKRIKVTALDVAKPMIALVTVNILVLSLWTAFAPLSQTTVVISTDTFGRATETFSECSSENPIPYFTTLTVVDLGTLAFSAYKAYRSRNISTEFAESESIFMAITLILLVSIMGIPILIIASENADAYFFVFTGLIVTTCCAVLLLIFIPKIQNGDAKPSTESIRRSSISETWDIGGIQILNSPQQQEELREENKRLKKLLQAANLREMMDLVSSDDDDDDSHAGHDLETTSIGDDPKQ